MYGSYLDYMFIKRIKKLPKISDIISSYSFIRKQGIKEKDKNNSVDVSSLVGMNYILTKNVKEYYILPHNEKWTIPTVGYIYRRSQAIVTDLYKAPILLITGGTKIDLHAVAAISYSDGVFKSSLTGIKGFTEESIPLLRNIQAMLNSNFFAYYNLLTFSSSGIEREETHDDEKLNIPYCDGLNKIVENMEELMKEIKEFNEERDWDQFHSPENLAKSIAIEAGELLECFQWNNNYDKEEVYEELADVFTYALQMAMKLEVSPEEIIRKKLDKTRKKYPVEKAKGVSTKYNKL